MKYNFLLIMTIFIVAGCLSDPKKKTIIQNEPFKFNLLNSHSSDSLNREWNLIVNHQYRLDVLHDAIIDREGAILLLGDSRNERRSPSDAYIWLKKYSNEGSPQEKVLHNQERNNLYENDDKTQPQLCIAQSLAQDSRGDYYISYFVGIESPVNEWNLVIRKFNTNLKEDINNWKKIIKLTPPIYSNKQSAIAIGHDDSVYVTASANAVNENTKTDIIIKKFSHDGIEDITNWNKSIDFGGDHDLIAAIDVDSYGYVYISGTSINAVNSKSKHDIFIKKFDSNGNEDISWNKKIDFSNKRDWIYSMCIDNDDSLYICGAVNDLLGENTLENWFIRKYDKYGKMLEAWNKDIDFNNGRDRAYTISFDGKDTIWIGGISENNKTKDNKLIIKAYSKNGILKTKKVFDLKTDGNKLTQLIGYDDNKALLFGTVIQFKSDRKTWYSSVVVGSY